MRRILIVLLLIIALAALWLWRGRDITMFVDQFRVIEASSRPIKTITYEGSGTGGMLHVDDLALSLNEVQLGGLQPRIGSTKDNQLAVSFDKKVFPFGLTSGSEALATSAPVDDVAGVKLQHSAIPWPNFFELNFMTGSTPKWKRNTYQRLTWEKPTGAKLEMLWRYEEYFYPGNGWTEALMTREGATGLIRVEISEPSR